MSYSPQYSATRFALLDAIGVALAVCDVVPGRASRLVVERALARYDYYCKIKAR